MELVKIPASSAAASSAYTAESSGSASGAAGLIDGGDKYWAGNSTYANSWNDVPVIRFSEALPAGPYILGVSFRSYIPDSFAICLSAVDTTNRTTLLSNKVREVSARGTDDLNKTFDDSTAAVAAAEYFLVFDAAAPFTNLALVATSAYRIGGTPYMDRYRIGELTLYTAAENPVNIGNLSLPVKPFKDDFAGWQRRVISETGSEGFLEYIPSEGATAFLVAGRAGGRQVTGFVSAGLYDRVYLATDNVVAELFSVGSAQRFFIKVPPASSFSISVTWVDERYEYEYQQYLEVFDSNYDKLFGSDTHQGVYSSSDRMTWTGHASSSPPYSTYNANATAFAYVYEYFGEHVADAPHVDRVNQTVLTKAPLGDIQVTALSQQVLSKMPLSDIQVTQASQQILQKQALADINVTQTSQQLLVADKSLPELQVAGTWLTAVFLKDDADIRTTQLSQQLLTKLGTASLNLTRVSQELLLKQGPSDFRITQLSQSVLIKLDPSEFFLNFQPLEYPVAGDLYETEQVRGWNTQDIIYIQLEGIFPEGTTILRNGEEVGLTTQVSEGDYISVRGGVTNYFTTAINIYKYEMINDEIHRSPGGLWPVVQPDLNPIPRWSLESRTVQSLGWLDSVGVPALTEGYAAFAHSTASFAHLLEPESHSAPAYSFAQNDFDYSAPILYFKDVAYGDRSAHATLAYIDGFIAQYGEAEKKAPYKALAAVLTAHYASFEDATALQNTVLYSIPVTSETQAYNSYVGAMLGNEVHTTANTAIDNQGFSTRTETVVEIGTESELHYHGVNKVDQYFEHSWQTTYNVDQYFEHSWQTTYSVGQQFEKHVFNSYLVNQNWEAFAYGTFAVGLLEPLVPVSYVDGRPALVLVGQNPITHAASIAKVKYTVVEAEYAGMKNAIQVFVNIQSTLQAYRGEYVQAVYQNRLVNKAYTYTAARVNEVDILSASEFGNAEDYFDSASKYMGFDTRAALLEHTQYFDEVEEYERLNGFYYNLGIDESFSCQITVNMPVKWLLQGG